MTSPGKQKSTYFPRHPKRGTPEILKHTGNATDKRGNVSVGVAGVKASKSPFYKRKKRT